MTCAGPTGGERVSRVKCSKLFLRGDIMVVKGDSKISAVTFAISLHHISQRNKRETRQKITRTIIGTPRDPTDTTARCGDAFRNELTIFTRYNHANIVYLLFIQAYRCLYYM